jgi:hypothetical protein
MSSLGKSQMLSSQMLGKSQMLGAQALHIIILFAYCFFV